METLRKSTRVLFVSSLSLGIGTRRITLLLIGAISSSLLTSWLRSTVVTIARVSCRVTKWCCGAPLRVGTEISTSLWVASTWPIAISHAIALWVALAVLCIASRSRRCSRVGSCRRSSTCCSCRWGPWKARGPSCLVGSCRITTLGSHLVAWIRAARVWGAGRGRLRRWPLLRWGLGWAYLWRIASIRATGRPSTRLMLL